MLKAMLLALAFAGLTAQAPAPPPAAHSYAAGQVWEYRTRPGDEGSLLKIQRIEPFPPNAPREQVYHVTVIGVRLAGGAGPTMLQHLPVSRATLDASVTRPATRTADFPSADEGIGVWREQHGGIFTIPMDQIVAAADQAMIRQRARDALVLPQ